MNVLLLHLLFQGYLALVVSLPCTAEYSSAKFRTHKRATQAVIRKEQKAGTIYFIIKKAVGNSRHDFIINRLG